MARYGTINEAAVLKKYASEARQGIVEIGVLDGETTKLMSEVATVPIYAIDPIVPDSMNPSLLGHEDQILRNMAHYKQFTFFKDFSYNVAKTWDKPVDMIFIDGDHHYEAVKQDVEMWSKLVKGVMLLHDSAPIVGFAGHTGPTRLVKEMRESGYQYIDTWDTLTGFII
jgi:hypothetical protein